MRWRAAFTALVFALAVGGCGDDGDDTSTTAAVTSTTPATQTTKPASDDGTAPAKAPPPLTACGAAGAEWQPLKVRAGPAKLDAAVIGKSDSAVVFANESGDASCPWVQFAKELEGKGLEVALFSYASVGDPREITAVAEALRSRGAKRVAAIGGSVGARAVVELAAMPDPGVDASISLSAERTVAGYPEILPKAKRAELPSFYISSRGDGYTLFGKETKEFHEVTPAEVNDILLVPGSGHGVDLVHGQEGREVRPAIVAFLGKLGFGAG